MPSRHIQASAVGICVAEQRNQARVPEASCMHAKHLMPVDISATQLSTGDELFGRIFVACRG